MFSSLSFTASMTEVMIGWDWLICQEVHRSLLDAEVPNEFLTSSIKSLHLIIYCLYYVQSDNNLCSF